MPATNGLVAAAEFRSFARLVSALYHFEFHDREQSVIEAWEQVEDDHHLSHNVDVEPLKPASTYTPPRGTRSS